MQKSYLVKSIGIIIVCSFVYFLFLRPLRVYLNEKVLAPVVNRLSGENTKVSIPKENPFAISIGREVTENFMKIKLPFGKFMLIPLTVLLLTNSWSLIRSLTISHVLVTLVLPVMFALIFIDRHWLTTLSSIFITLNIVFGLSFTVIGLNCLFTRKTN
jgi:hypothetical protein